MGTTEPTVAEMMRSDDLRDVLLAELRLARTRVKLALNSLDTIGHSLKIGIIDVETAMAWLAKVDADRFVDLDGYEPFADHG